MSKRYRTYVGADLHKTFTYFTAQDQRVKEKASVRVENRGEYFRDFLESMEQPLKVVVESKSNRAWFCEEVNEGGFDVVVAHAAETSVKSGAKEKSDAGTSVCWPRC